MDHLVTHLFQEHLCQCRSCLDCQFRSARDAVHPQMCQKQYEQQTLRLHPITIYNIHCKKKYLQKAEKKLGKGTSATKPSHFLIPC